MKRKLLLIPGLLFVGILQGLNAQDCVLGTSKSNLDINNVRAMMLNAGDLFWDVNGTSNACYEVPKGSGKNMLFTGALWIGGIDSTANVYVAAETYRAGGTQSYFPGPIVDSSNVSTSSSNCEEWDRHFKVHRSTIDQFRLDFQNGSIQSPSQIPLELLEWPGRNNPYLANNISYLDAELAPFVDVNGNEIYDPLFRDYPDVLGDQSIWWVMNDVGGEKQLGNGNQERVIGLEVQVQAFAFQTDDGLNDVTFQKYTLINKGQIQLNNTYCGFMIDADIGNYNDDYCASDVERGMAIFYNGKPIDSGMNGYGAYPPAIGIDFVKGIKADSNDNIDNNRNCMLDEPNEDIQMSNFMMYYSSPSLQTGNPSRKTDFYNYLSSTWKDGFLISYDGINGLVQGAAQAKFMFPMNSDDQYGWNFGGNCATPYTGLDNVYWSEATAGNDPADRRGVMSMGPFTFEAGATKEFIVAFVYARDSVNASIDALKEVDDLVQEACDNGFEDYTSILGVNKSIGEVHLARVFPTKVTQNLNIRLSSLDLVELSIFDATGKQILSQAVRSSATIDFCASAKGLYYYRISDGTIQQTGKFVKL